MNSQKNRYGILVNTCDNFEDCWLPYFKLKAKFWPDCTARIYLNTETKDFSYPGLNVVALRVARPVQRKLTWSECLIRALDKIKEDIVLYMQEDYFLKERVQNQWVEHYVMLMHGDQSIHCIHLTDQGVIPDGQSQYPGLYGVKVRQRYRVSCQAALWRKDVLKALLRAHENAWQFEWFGSKRSAKMHHNFYVVDPNWVKLNQFEIIPYVFTGIVKGRWKEEVVPLFLNHDITLDFTLRGFIKDAHPRSWPTKFVDFTKRVPIMLESYLDLILLNAGNKKI